MSTTPEQIAQAIATFCQNVSGLRTVTDPTTITNPPVAAVLPPTGTFIDYRVALEHGIAAYSWRIVILVSRSHDRSTLPQLYGYLATSGSMSIPAAILTDPTLGHTVDYCVPVEATGPHDIVWAGVDYLGAEILVEAGAE